MAAEGAGTRVLFLEDAPRETLLFHRLTPTPKGPKAVEGCRRLSDGLHVCARSGQPPTAVSLGPAGPSVWGARLMRALVTGAGARLGQAMALYLGARGYDVAVHYSSSEEGANETVTLLKAMGRIAVTLKADLLDEGETEALLPAAANALGGPITCLINNASIFEYDSITSATRKSWDRHIGSNLRAPFILTQALAAQAPMTATDANGEPMARSLQSTFLSTNQIDAQFL